MTHLGYYERNPMVPNLDKKEGKNGLISFSQKERILGRVQNKHLHSKKHLLADDLSRMLGEPKRFAAYLGLAKLYYESDLRGMAKRVLEKPDLPAEARGKYFFACLKGLAKKTGTKLKRKKTKKREKPRIKKK